MSFLRQCFIPPDLEDEHERYFVLSFLRGILSFSIIITILIGIGLSIYSKGNLPLEIMISGTVLLLGEFIAFLFCLLKHPRIASVMLITLSWAYVSYTTIAFGGLANPVSSTMIIVLLISGTLLGEFGIVLMSGLALSSSMGVAYLWMNGMMPEPILVLSPVQAWIVYFSNILAGGVIMLLWYRHIRKTMQYIQQEAYERKMAEVALRESESRYRQAIMAANAVPYALDYATNKYVFMGEDIANILGYTPEELTPDVFSSQVTETILHDDLEGITRDGAMELIRSNQVKNVIWRADLHMVTKSGEKRWLSDASVQIVNESGDNVGSIGILQDITDRKHAEDHIRKLNNELEKRVRERTSELQEALNELESFSYTVSHDLRAPLRAIHGYTRILALDHGPQLQQEAQDYLEKIQQNAKTMGQLVDGLLDFSRVGRQQIHKKNVDMTVMFNQTLEELKVIEHAPELEIILLSLPPCQADPVLIKQVAVNLLSNAIKFTRIREKARIEIGSIDQGKKPVYFVRDNGVGFDMKYADKIFGVFQRLHPEDKFEGTGVGTAIVHRIITKHGGEVWAESEVDQGAVFYFTVGWRPAK